MNMNMNMNMIITNTKMVLRVMIVVLFISEIAVSQSIIHTLPGYPGKLPFKLETGYIEIGEKEDVHLFYYFVESERNPRSDPIIIWLSGGPSCSALRGFFYEIGPLNFNYAKSKYKPTLELNPYSWTKVANIIFLDQPVNTGFSYADTFEASKTSDTLSATQTYEFLRKWLRFHPRFMSNPLYICGISYSGIFVPAIVQKIYEGNEDGHETPINIKGYILGNPVTDKIDDYNSRVKYAHRLALISDELYKSSSENCLGDYTPSSSGNALCQNDLKAISKSIDNINYVHILEPLCIEKEYSNLKRDGGSYEDNPISMDTTWCRVDNYVFLSMWAKDKAVQKALHIREGTIGEWVRCNQEMRYAFGRNDTSIYSFNVVSSVNYHRNLIDKRCRALIFSGDHDLVVPYLSTEKWIRFLNLTLKNNWDPWFVGDQVAGFASTFSHNDYSLTFATLKGAGHTGPEYKPKESLAMVDRWFFDYPL
ncbi:hypothetical protein LguiA_008709 [Lonicera macranthoides]